MEAGYAAFQLGGPRSENPSVNQHKHLGGNQPAFFAEFYSETGRLALTSQTVATEDELNRVIDTSMGRLLDGNYNHVPVSQFVIDRQFRGIVC